MEQKKFVLAHDEFYGTYLGEQISVLCTHIARMAKVKILKTIKNPSQRAILFPNMFFHREPYERGKIVNFKCDSTIPLNGANFEEMAPEEILKYLER